MELHHVICLQQSVDLMHDMQANVQAAREQGLDLAARERVKAADIEEWIAQQFRSGEAQSNPNFIPLSVDWRARIKAKQAAAAAAAAAAIANAQAAKSAADEVVLHYDAEPDLDLLSTGLVDGWAAMWDATSGDVYYGNKATQVRASS